MKMHGFTLIELLTTLAVVAIVALIAVPGLADLLQRQRLDAARQQLMGALMLTRQQAVLLGRSLTLGPDDGNWNRGWMLFADENDNAHLDDGETLLRHFPALPDALRLSANTPLSSYVRYMPDGQARLLGGAFQAGTLTLCHISRRIAGTQLILSIGGRVRQAPAGDACP